MRLSFPILALALAGCATLNESECRTADWRQIGVRDGTAGYARDRVDAHRDACREYGIGLDDSAWRSGYEDGLTHYCMADNGYQVGRRGENYGGVCPADIAPAFVSAYSLGKETYDVEQQLGQVQQQTDSLESKLGSKKTTDDQRYDIRRELGSLYQQSTFLRRSLDRLEHEWYVRQQHP